MFKHVNVERKKEKIRKLYSESLYMFDRNNFFEIINFLGCYLAALFKSSYSASDCCNTVEILEKLFSIKNNKIKHINANELNNIFKEEGNYFFNFKIMGKGIPFHTFVVIKYNDEWFLLQSFAGICGLKVFQDSDIPNRLKDFLHQPTSEEFNSLFGTNLSENNEIKSIDIMLSYEIFTELPLKTLYNLIYNFLYN